MAAKPLLELAPEGLYCPLGGFYIDPWRKVEKAVITHGHGDHARWGMESYLCATPSVPILTARISPDIRISALDYGEPLVVNGVRLSLHPAGHIPGSAQVRVEHQGQVWVVTGDYKTESDKTSTPFELVKCNGIVTETTFGLPIYQWRPEEQIFEDINHWWLQNQANGSATIILGYSLGKAQRILGGVNPEIGPIIVHGAVASMNRACEAAGVRLPHWSLVSEKPPGIPWSKCLIVAPPGSEGTSWGAKFGKSATAFASGWMAVRGTRRWQSVDRGFALSDHVDWPSLNSVVKECGAETVWTTHGFAEQTARWFRELGLDARPLATQFSGEEQAENLS